MRKPLLLILFLSCFSVSDAQNSSKHSVYFQLDKADVSSGEQSKLLSWLDDVTNSIKKLEVIDYADFLGSDSDNLELSERRATAVVTLIEELSTNHYGMSWVTAKGESESISSSESSGNPQDRRVDVVIHLTPKKISVVKEESFEGKSMEEAKVGESIILNNLNFFPGQHFLVPQAMPELDGLISKMMENPHLEIEIQGHICCKLDTVDGFDMHTRTYTLSTNRAKYIFDQLVLAGVKPERMKYIGFAGSRPLVLPEITAEDQNRNRRVEIKILKK